MEVAPRSSMPLDERRRLRRLPFNVPVQFRDVLKPQEPFAGSLSIELSAAGLRLATSMPVAVETRVVLLLSLPGTLKPIRLIGQVVWSRMLRVGFHESGIRFIELNPEDREAIVGYVERQNPTPVSPSHLPRKGSR